MIVTEIYNGQGLGNQLWCYVVTRAIAKKHGYDFGIMHPEKFKCLDFMDLDFGKEVIGGTGPEGGVPRTLPLGITHYYREREIRHPETNVDIRIYDSNLVSIPDATKIDGYMQDEQYITEYKDEIRGWLKLQPKYTATEYASDDICILNFRGGEYVRIKDVFLSKKYWTDAIAHMRKINPTFRFVVVTDDVPTARKFFPDFEISHKSIGSDYSILAHAHYLILSNSSFAWFPAWLSQKAKKIIAPKYWASHNISDGYWSCGYALTQGFEYLDRDGNLTSHDTCAQEYETYTKKHTTVYTQKKIESAFLVVSNYYNDICWVPRYTNNYYIYDQSASAILSPYIDTTKVIKSEHRGHNIRDYCTFIIEHYDSLPDTIIFTAGNVFPRHVSEEYFKTALDQKGLVPLIEQKRHTPHKPISYIDEHGLYAEYNSSWYLRHHPTKYFKSYNDFLRFVFKNPKLPTYIHFAPGANYIVPKENILAYPKSFYENLRLFVSHTDVAIPGESHIIERALYTIWNTPLEITEAMQSILPATFKGVPKTPEPLSQQIQKTLYRGLASMFSAQTKIQYLFQKLPSAMQYVTGKRNISDLHKRASTTPLVIHVKKIFNLPGALIRKIQLQLRKTLSALATYAYSQHSKNIKAITDYHKTIKIYDVFTFFNELELLEIRLNILAPHVDYFVLIECAETFSGKPKSLYYAENKERFAQFQDKIIHYVVENVPTSRQELAQRLDATEINPLEKEIIKNALTSDNVPKNQLHWLKEFYQKESIKKALVGLSPTDICYIGDVDEIWNPETVIDYRKNNIFKLRQIVYAYYLNNRSNEPWAGTLVTQYKNIQKACLNHLRTARKTTYTYIPNGGWHFTNMGGVERIKTKLESYGHQEFNTVTIKSDLEAKIKNNQDFVGRGFTFHHDESALPQYLQQNKEKYKNLFK